MSFGRCSSWFECQHRRVLAQFMAMKHENVTMNMTIWLNQWTMHLVCLQSIPPISHNVDREHSNGTTFGFNDLWGNYPSFRRNHHIFPKRAVTFCVHLCKCSVQVQGRGFLLLAYTTICHILDGEWFFGDVQYLTKSYTIAAVPDIT